jgi:glycosyltransferase involved in cell wall biosynthesis
MHAMSRFPYSLTIAIPAYNEEETLSNVVSGAITAAKTLVSVYEILIVDDGSTDKTGAIADTFAKEHRWVKVVHHLKNQGFSGAIKTCYKKSAKELIFLLPADGQIHAGDAKLFLKVIHNADVVVGYRENNPEPLFRRFNSKVFHTFYRILFGVQLREISTSILWRKTVIDKIDITAMPRSALIEPEVVYKAWTMNFRFAEIPIPYYPRLGGSPKGANPLMILATFTELLRFWWEVRGKNLFRGSKNE